MAINCFMCGREFANGCCDLWTCDDCATRIDIVSFEDTKLDDEKTED